MSKLIKTTVKDMSDNIKELVEKIELRLSKATEIRDRTRESTVHIAAQASIHALEDLLEPLKALSSIQGDGVRDVVDEDIRKRILEILRESMYDFDYGYSKDVGVLNVRMVNRNLASYKLLEYFKSQSTVKEQGSDEEFILKMRRMTDDLIAKGPEACTRFLIDAGIIEKSNQKIKALYMEVINQFIVKVKGHWQLLSCTAGDRYFITSNGGFGQRDLYFEEISAEEATGLIKEMHKEEMPRNYKQ